MKKKIKDLTISDILKYCKYKKCKDCVFSDYSDECQLKFITLHFEDYYEQEIEVEDDD